MEQIARGGWSGILLGLLCTDRQPETQTKLPKEFPWLFVNWTITTPPPLTLSLPCRAAAPEAAVLSGREDNGHLAGRGPLPFHCHGCLLNTDESHRVRTVGKLSNQPSILHKPYFLMVTQNKPAPCSPLSIVNSLVLLSWQVLLISLGS